MKLTPKQQSALRALESDVDELSRLVTGAWERESIGQLEFVRDLLQQILDYTDKALEAESEGDS